MKLTKEERQSMIAEIKENGFEIGRDKEGFWLLTKNGKDFTFKRLVAAHFFSLSN